MQTNGFFSPSICVCSFFFFLMTKWPDNRRRKNNRVISYREPDIHFEWVSLKPSVAYCGNKQIPWKMSEQKIALICAADVISGKSKFVNSFSHLQEIQFYLDIKRPRLFSISKIHLEVFSISHSENIKYIQVLCVMKITLWSFFSTTSVKPAISCMNRQEEEER